MMTRFALSRGQQEDRKRQGAFPQSERPLISIFLMLFCGLCLSLFLSACTGLFSAPAQGGGGTVTLSSPTPVASSPTPSTALRTIVKNVSGSCPSYVAATNWDSLLGTKSGVDKVQLVSCGSLEGSGSLEAVVGVGYYTLDARLDVYVFDHLTSTPTITFKVPGLIDGDAQISPTGSLVTAEIGLKGIPSKTTNLFKEYQWNGSGFVQVLFPYLYPDMTLYQAEQDNTLVTGEIAAGQKADLWKTSGTEEAAHLALSIFLWSTVTQTVLTYDKAADTIIVQINNTAPGGGGFIATLHHLDGNANNILEIASVRPLDSNTTLTSPAPGAQLTSPISVSGVALAGSQILGEVAVFDDTYILAGNSGPIASSGSSYVTFTNSVKYSLNASGLQEGVVVLMTTDQNNPALTSQIEMIKVFLSA